MGYLACDLLLPGSSSLEKNGMVWVQLCQKNLRNKCQKLSYQSVPASNNWDWSEVIRRYPFYPPTILEKEKRRKPKTCMVWMYWLCITVFVRRQVQKFLHEAVAQHDGRLAHAGLCILLPIQRWWGMGRAWGLRHLVPQYQEGSATTCCQSCKGIMIWTRRVARTSIQAR